MPHRDNTSRQARRRRPRPRSLKRTIQERQRKRVLDAAVDVVARDGYAGMSVAKVISRARISRRTFYEHFAGCEDCFLAAFEQYVSEIRAIVRAASCSEARLDDKLRAGVWSLLQVLDENPTVARICVVDALAAGPRVLERRSRTLTDAARTVDRVLGENVPAAERPFVSEAVVGAVLATLHARLLARGSSPLRDDFGLLMATLVLPYRGRAAARAALSTPPPALDTSSEGRLIGESSAMPELELRLTYRTIRVLTAIAEAPAASNREIAGAAEIVDQGQISKLLQRLQRSGLIENVGGGQSQGRPNSWLLTDLGERVQRATAGR